MGVIDKIRSRREDEVQPAGDPAVEATNEKGAPYVQDSEWSPASSDDNLTRAAKEIEAHPDQVTEGANPGVQKAEAAALVWPKKAVYAIYAWIWICYFILAFHSNISGNVLYYAYSRFEAASQVATASILASIVGGVMRLPVGKILSLWGRAEALLVSLAVFIVGIIVMAACNGPNAYAAGYTLYWVGYDAIYLILEIFIADTSGIRNRAFAFGFATTPFICTAFTGPLAATSFLQTSGWRWAYGAFAIVMPAVFVPLAGVFKFYEMKARKMGLLKTTSSGRTLKESIMYYVHEFDIIGAVILMAAWVLFLLPFSLETEGRAGYSSASFIAPVIVGLCLFPVFAAWERWFARVHFVPYRLLLDRSVVGACLLAAVLYFCFYSWNLYFYYFVMLVYNLDTSMTGYMTQIYNVGSCFWSPIFGMWIRYVREFKYSCLGFALPLMTLGAGLMIHFRGEGDDIGYIIMCQIFIAISGGMLVIGQQMSVMCASDRNNMPILLSVLSLSPSFGGAIGDAVSGAIYANTFPNALRDRLPASERDSWQAIYAGGYLAQLEYPVGTAARDAINYAYGYSQKYGCIAATASLALAFPCIAIWKHYRVNKEQNKGMVL